jgi:hypothetical protein
MNSQTPRHAISGEPAIEPARRASAVPIGQTQAPPMKCTIASTRPRMAFGAYSPA